MEHYTRAMSRTKPENRNTHTVHAKVSTELRASRLLLPSTAHRESSALPTHPWNIEMSQG
eukprot:scaffold32574_cov66-Phaeocystis_antarctica.AAC.2